MWGLFIALVVDRQREAHLAMIPCGDAELYGMVKVIQKNGNWILFAVVFGALV